MGFEKTSTDNTSVVNDLGKLIDVVKLAIKKTSECGDGGFSMGDNNLIKQDEVLDKFEERLKKTLDGNEKLEKYKIKELLENFLKEKNIKTLSINKFWIKTDERSVYNQFADNNPNAAFYIDKIWDNPIFKRIVKKYSQEE